MSDTVKAWHEMQQEEKDKIRKSGDFKPTMYIFVLDFLDGKVYRYDISALCNDKNWSSPNYWNPDSESCEAFLIGAGHNIGNCEWMVTSEKTIEYGN